MPSSQDPQPLTRSPDPTASRSGAAPEGGVPQNSLVLVVDDNQQNLELLQAYLEDLGCPVRTATDGVECLAEVRRKQPDLILLDVMMPKMSGFQACEHLKADPTTRDIPIIMVTALNEVSDVEKAIESGANDFLTKPVNKLELLTRAKSLLAFRAVKLERDRLISRLRERGDG